MIKKVYSYIKFFIERCVCNLCKCNQRIQTELENNIQLELDKELEKFKLLKSNARYNYIRNLALVINLERMYIILNGSSTARNNYTTIISLNAECTHYTIVPDFKINEPNTYVITSVWSSEKLKSNSMSDFVKKYGLKESLCDGDVDGFYLVDYGILFTYNDNHRICHAQQLGDYSIDIDKHYRIEKIKLTDAFLDININQLNDIYLTKNEKLFYKAMQIYHLQKNSEE
jgi:hypothetical protein